MLENKKQNSNENSFVGDFYICLTSCPYFLFYFSKPDFLKCKNIHLKDEK